MFQRHISSTLSQLGREAAKIVLHSECVSCSRELPWRSRTGSCCADCWSSLPEITTTKCERCAIPWDTSNRGERFVCLVCSASPPPMEWTDSWGRYSGSLERVLQSFKFGRHDFLSVPLAAHLRVLLERRNDFEFDAVVPVPMHWRRQRARGFNQAELLARELSQTTPIRLRLDLLSRTANGKPQSLLSREDRRQNVVGAFRSSSLATGSSILLVDDICTTGETLGACANALLSSGAHRVCAVTVARTC